jgi:hypothetical protein
MDKQFQEFRTFTTYKGLIYTDDSENNVYGFRNHTATEMFKAGGGFGYLATGKLRISENGIEVTVPEGFWFSTTGRTIIECQNATFLFVERIGYNGFLSLGLVEDSGRLKYIDGAFDTILHSPIRLGDPCLNALFMGSGILQTEHTHPSLRVGFIIRGGATCEAGGERHLLQDNMIFVLPKDVKHLFRSDLEDDIRMKLVAYHPDSDFGPTDELHPMLNRTIVNGVSANQIDEIRTK